MASFVIKFSPKAAHHPASFKMNYFLLLLLTITTTTTIIQAQEFLFYVTWESGALCNKKPAGDFNSWEQSYTSLQTCCEEKFGYDYDNCCNPTAPELQSCFEEACTVRTCSNGGLYSDDLCGCMCVPPFSLDEDGDCTATGGENSFASCTVNVDCPWWSDPLILEKCDTGSEIPEGVTEVDWTREECCERHHLGSKFCNGSANGGGGGADDSNVDLGKFEVIPMKFSIGNLPDDMDIEDLKEQVRTVLKDFLLELSVRFTGAADLGVSSVKETSRFDGLEEGMNQVEGVDVYYDVKVIREPEQEFAPTIIEEVIDLYENIVRDIQDNVSAELYVNICMEGDEEDSASSMFNRCALQPEEVTTKFLLKDLPQEIMNNTASFDEMKMVITEAYKEILQLPDDDDGFTPTLLSIAGKEEVSLGNGTIEVHFNIVFRGGNNGAEYDVDDKIARYRAVIVNRLQSYTDEDTDWNVNWCTKETSLTVCAPGDEALLGGVTASETENGNGTKNASETRKGFPRWGYILIAAVAGVIVLICMCKCCKLEGSCCRSRKVSRGRTKKAVRMNQLNMKSYIDTGRQSEKKSSMKNRVVYQKRRSKSKSRHSRSTVERSVRKHRSDKERRHRSSSRSRRRDKQSNGLSSSSRSRKSSSRRSSSRKRSRKITNDSDNMSISSFDPEKQDDQVVMYEGEEQLFHIDDNEEEEEQVKVRREPIRNIRSRPKPDPDGFSMLSNNNQELEGDSERLVSFRV